MDIAVVDSEDTGICETSSVHVFGWYVDDVLLLLAPLFDESPDDTDCSSSNCSGGSCGSNTGTDAGVGEGGAQMSFGLGMTNDSQSAGFLRFQQLQLPETAGDLFLPKLLAVVGIDDNDSIYDSNGLRQVYTKNLLVDIYVADANDNYVGYEIRYYDVGTIALDNGLYPISGSAFRTIRIRQQGASNDNLRIEEYDGTTISRVREFGWDSSNELWTLYDGMNKADDAITSTATQTITSSTSMNATNDIRTEEQTIWTDSGKGTVLSKIQKKYQQYLWSWELIEQTINPGTDETKTQWGYYDDETSIYDYGKLRYHITSDGYWEYYIYEDGTGNLQKTIAQYGSNLLDTSNLATLNLTTLATNNVVTIIEETSGTINSSEYIKIVKTTIEAPNGQSSEVKSVNYVVYRDNSGTYSATSDLFDTNEVWTIQSATADPENGYTDVLTFIQSVINNPNSQNHLISKTWRYKRSHTYAFKLFKSEAPDGQLTLHYYDMAYPDFRRKLL